MGHIFTAGNLIWKLFEGGYIQNKANTSDVHATLVAASLNEQCSLISSQRDYDVVLDPTHAMFQQLRQHLSSIIHHPSSIIQHPTSNIQHPTSNIQHPTSKSEKTLR
jgi:hypothetical protein